MAPDTIENIKKLSDHDILLRLYQCLLDHLKAYEEDCDSLHRLLGDHEKRLDSLETYKHQCEGSKHGKTEIWDLLKFITGAFIGALAVMVAVVGLSLKI